MPATPGRDEPSGQCRRNGREWGVLLAAWMFPVLCWFAATLFLGGNLGKNTDDYSINLRDPVTNTVPSPFNPLVRYPYFWRPLHNIMCFGVGTLWPEANRTVHVAVAAFHGLACLGLYFAMRRLTRTRVAPLAATVVFMVLPLHGEVAFWFCTTSTAIGSSLFFAAAIAAMAFARAERVRIGLLLGIFGIVFLVTCFYEQSAALCAGMPFLCMAVAPPSRAWAARASRAIAATLCAGAACLLYVKLLVATAPAAVRGGGQSFVSGNRAGERLTETLSGVHNVLYGERAQQIVRGSLQLGWETAASPKGLVLGSVLLASAALWLVWAVRRGGPCEQEQAGEIAAKGHGGWLFLAGAATFVAGWLPVYVIDHQIVEMRNAYVPLLGVAMMLAALLDGIAGALHGRAGVAARLVISLAAFVVIVPSTLALIGYQTCFQLRWLEDQREIAALHQMVPAPPPNTVFMPLRLGALATHTGHVLFDRSRYGVFETPWSAHAAVQHEYRRDDIGATSYNPWVATPRTPVDKPGEDGVRWTKGLSKDMTALFPKDPDGGLRIPWINAVPFVTDPDGQLRLIRRIDVERADHRDLEVRPPLVHAAMDAAKSQHAELLTSVYRMGEPEPEESRADLIPLRFWELADGSEAKFDKMTIWGTSREATWLAPGYQERASMSISLPPLDRSENLLIRATIAEYDVDPKRHAAARIEELAFSMASAPDRELAVLRLDPSRFRGLRKWESIVVVLPPRTDVAGDRLRIIPRLAKEPAVRLDPTYKAPLPADENASILPIWITHGYEQSIVVQPK